MALREMGYLVLLIFPSIGSVSLGLFLFCFYPWVPPLSICSGKEMDQAGEFCFLPAVVE